MLRNLAADALGISDIGSVIKPADYNKVEADDYVIHEEKEKIYFLIKSKTDEYCFTNLALIHLDGSSAVSKKRMLIRLDYAHNFIQNVRLETAGRVDLDIEIKFAIGDKTYSIDVNKQFLAELKDLYKSLIRISKIQQENNYFLQFAQTSLNLTATTLGRSSGSGSQVEQFQAINQYAFNWLRQTHETYVRKDFGEVFEKFIRE